VQALKLHDDAAAGDRPGLEDLVVLTPAIGVIDRITATNTFDRHSVCVIGR
jgi:hypothetical protein